jgi:hypothetical protein
VPGSSDPRVEPEDDGEAGKTDGEAGKTDGEAARTSTAKPEEDTREATPSHPPRRLE